MKILPNKQGTAMAHIDNQDSAKNAIQNLHGRKLMGSNLELKWGLLATLCISSAQLWEPIICVSIVQFQN